MSQDTRYDTATKTLWVSCHLDADSLVDTSELNTWTKALSAGQTADGKPLSTVNYVFSDAESAEYNQQPLSFSRIGTYTGTLQAPVALGDEPSFTDKSDFGI